MDTDYQPHFEEFLANDGDQCDSCGKSMQQDDVFLQDTRLRVRWRFCCQGCAQTGVTDKSRKARFIGFVLDR